MVIIRKQYQNLQRLDSLLKYQVFREFYYSNGLSCAALSEILGKSLPIIAKAVNQLIKADYVIEKGLAPSSGGRRPHLYALNPNKLFIVTVAMDQLITKIAISNLHQNDILPPESYELTLYGNDHSLGLLVTFIKNALRNAGIDKKDILGVGIGMPGFVNTTEGINYTYLPVENSTLTLKQKLEERLQLPVVIDNDSSVTALAELRFGLAKNYKDAMVVNIGWGIGLGMIIQGKLFRGSAGYAGELSHIPISESNKLCDCGKRGCLETEATLRVVVDKALKEIKERKTTGINFSGNYEQISESIMTAAKQGDQDAIDLITEMAYKIGKGLAILVHIVNPELIVISGRGVHAGKFLVAPIEQALNRYCIPRILESTRITTSALGSDASFKGAAALVIDHLLDIYEQESSSRSE